MNDEFKTRIKIVYIDFKKRFEIIIILKRIFLFLNI